MRKENGYLGQPRRVWMLVMVLTSLIGLSSLAAPPPAGIANVGSVAGGFGVDGDLAGGMPGAGVGDWLAGTNTTGLLRPDGSVFDPATTFHFNDPYGNSGADLIFGGGLKWTDNPNSWAWTSGKPSAKTEMNNVLLHIGTDTQGHVWSIISADRASVSGDSYIDFEFLQNTLYRTNGSAFVSAGPHGGRTTNDLLLSLAFTGGGKVADFFAWRWIETSPGSFAYVDATASLPAGRVFAALNTAAIPVPYGAFGSTTYEPNAFAEAAVDMTALLGSFDPCVSFGFRTIMIKTKASASSSASIEDFIDPIQYSLQIGPAAKAGPDQARCTEGAITRFPLDGAVTQGIHPVVSTTWTVVSGEAVIENPSSLTTAARLTGGSATLRLTALQANGCVAVDEVTLTIKALPPAAIAGPETVCPQSATTFEAPVNMSGYAWSVAGNGAIHGPANSRTVTVTAGGACGEPFTLNLTVTAAGCASNAAHTVQVQDLTPPEITAPAALTLECPSPTGTNLTGVATASDNCGPVVVAFSDREQPLCGAARQITRTWTATDLCGNQSSAIQVITVQDTRKPRLTVPAAISLECPAEPVTTVTGMATATDDCSAVIVSFTDQVANLCGSARIITRTWTATDACGNTETAVQTITIRDSAKPSLIVPGNLVLECPADTGTNATGSATGSDTCGQVVIGYTDRMTNNCGGSHTLVRTWTATDECGNRATADQLITVRDTARPILVVPPSLVLECPADTGTNATGVATGSDACSALSITFADAISNRCGASIVIARTWTASDECGNQVSGVQTIEVRDTSKPVLTVPSDLTLECPADTLPAATGVAVANDTCGSASVRYEDAVTPGCGGARTIVRTWIATDDCGNVATGLQRIVVQDTTRPILSVPPSVVLDCPADTYPSATGTATAQDACGRVSVSFADQVTAGCGGSKTIVRTWTAVDECGNVSSAAQTVSVRDVTPPILTVPADLTLECGSSTATNATGVASAQDACGKVTLRHADSVTDLCGNTRIIRRAWTAVDECGNATERVQTLTVKDTLPPTLVLPADLVIECPGDTRTSATGMATAQDICGSVVVTHNDLITNGCGSTRTVLRLWTALDECGNSTNGLQTIVVRDTRKPTITSRPITVQCVGDVPAPYPNLAAFLAAGGSAIDQCDGLLDFALVSDSGLVGSCPGNVTRVYRVTDDCGNTADTTQVITVADTIPPTIVAPPSLDISCTNSIEPAALGQASATDNCDANVQITYTNRIVSSQYTINWYASDPVNQSAPYLPTYLKASPGDLPCPDSAQLTGRAIDPLRHAVAYGPTAGQLDALTSLGGEPMALGQVVPFQAVIEVSGGPGPERGTIEFTASWATHTTSNDEFGYDKNYMVRCAFVDPSDLGSIDPHGNARIEHYSSKLVNAGTIDEQIHGTFRVSGLDIGDRVVVEIWVVLMSTMPRTVGGTIASDLVSAQKVLTPPQPITVGTKTISIGNLGKIGELPPVTSQPPPPSLPPQLPVPEGSIVQVIDRTWTAVDDCGNTRSAVQTITIWDAQAPQLIVPADVSLECPAAATTNVAGLAAALDTCGAALVTYSDQETVVSSGVRMIARTWTATDEFGNKATGVQTITIEDTTPPALSEPPAKSVIEGEVWSFDEPIAWDECSPTVVHVLDTQTNQPISGNSYQVTRVWEAMDAAGNREQASQIVTVTIPSVAPTITAQPGSASGGVGQQITLNVAATGTQPFTYQWRLNGAPIAGATQSSLTLNDLQFSSAGLYSVVVGNAGGSAVSAPAVIQVVPSLGITRSASGMVLTWPAGFALQSAAAPQGPYVDVAGAVSPYQVKTAEALQRYYRLRSLPFAVNTSFLADGTAQVSVSGSPGLVFLLQASSDLNSWTTIATNTAPSVILDPNASQFPVRHYRAIPFNGNGQTATLPSLGTPLMGKTIRFGHELRLSSGASGLNLLHQWIRDGDAIPGATGPDYVVPAARFSNAGVYTVLVGNSAGTVVSAPAIINVVPELSTQSKPGHLTLFWPEPYRLQTAPTVTGPFSTLETAASPHTVETTAPQQFFRLEVPVGRVSPAPRADGSVSLSLTGAPGRTYVIQGAATLGAWVNLATNAAPLTVIDEAAKAAGRRFYRAVPTP